MQKSEKPVENKLEKKAEKTDDKKKDKIEQAMRLLSTLETVKMAKKEDKANILQDIQ